MTDKEKAKAYDEALLKAKNYINIKGIGEAVELCEELFPQLKENEDEDERIRKDLISALMWQRNNFGVMEPHNNNLILPGFTMKVGKILAYLEKQKEPHYTKRNALFDKCVENCDPKTVEEVNKRVDDIMNMPELSAFEQALTNFIGYWEDDEERWPSKFVKKHGKHILDMAKEELQKEQKPILEVFGFKVGDAVRLKDGDGRKHIIKSFEEVEGIHGPNFYHVEFEDNSARDGIYPGEEYPNGYYTQMEKFEEEQKPVEIHIDNPNIQKVDPDIKISKSDSSASGGAVNVESDYDKGWRDGHRAGLKDVENDKCKIIEKHITKNVISDEVEKRLKECGWYVTAKENIRWNEKDEKIRNNLIEFLIRLSANTRTDSTSPNYSYPREIAWLKSLPERFNLHPKQEWSEEDEKNLGQVISGRYLPLGLREWFCGLPERFPSRPSWKPSEEQMMALLNAEGFLRAGLQHDSAKTIAELYEQLKKLQTIGCGI